MATHLVQDNKCMNSKAVPLTEKQIREIISSCDSNHDNLLDMDDLEKAFRQLGSKLPGFRATRVMRYADANRDGPST
ncbi:hypothetical protein JCGZ_04282 [Jatropha curcas]|uniref:EF-hand domain-containing protein n=1 Tax=Jatropha curcas TaxID=180498 RepID=A0A067KQF3_JATCU|nr:hypothetical protein JCGZ_04282 [Jatropha curcas]